MATFGNRATRAVDAAREKIATTLAEGPEGEAAVAKLDAILALGPMEHYEFQNAQARAHASGVITADEAQVIYAALGDPCGSDDNGGWAAGTDTATKLAVTKMIQEILSARISGRRAGAGAR